MGVVTAAFLVGGNLEKLLCEPYHSKELFKVRSTSPGLRGVWGVWAQVPSGLTCCGSQLLDTPYMVDPQWKNFIPGFLYNDSDLDLTVENLYR